MQSRLAKIKSIFFIFFVGFVFLPLSCLAESLNVSVPNIAISIPGFYGFTQLSCAQGEICDNPWFAEYITAITKYALGVIGLIAVTVMTFGGFLWLVGRAEEGKKWMAGAVSGLILAMSFSVALSMINPDLLNIKGVGMQTINWDKLLVAELPVHAPAPEPGNTGYVAPSEPVAQLSGDRTAKVRLPESVWQLAEKMGAQYGVNKNIVAAIIMAESSGNQNAVSPVGATGLMQLMPKTAEWLKVDANNSHDNVKGGTMYIGQLLKKYNNNLNTALAAYNWGPGNVDKKGTGNLPTETRNYIVRINKYLGR